MSETTQTACAATYVVKRGDSFYLISRRLGVPLRDLLAANPDIHPARLTVGDVLCLPVTEDALTPAKDCPTTPPSEESGETEQPPAEETPPTETTCPEGRRAVIAEGQTASDLQLQYDLSRHTLEAANPDTDLDALAAGDIVCVPPVNLPCSLPATVELTEGQTLASVAVTYNLPVASLLRANPCLAPDDFMAGVTIKLPQ